MPFDLAALTSTPDIRNVPELHARIVCALRYTHIARSRKCYCAQRLAEHLGTPGAVHCFHVYLDEFGRALPEPIALNPPCQPRMSYDEMLMVDCATAAAKDDRKTFNHFLSDMIGEGGRRSVWLAARRLTLAMGVR